MDNFPKLRSLGPGARLGVACLVLVVLGGVLASARQLWLHHENRDGQPGVSVTDLMGAYHGVSAPAPLVTSLLRAHPDKLPPAKRDALLNWLQGKPGPAGTRPPGGNPRVAEDYDNLDLGDNSPAEIIKADCLSCHGRANAGANPIARTIPLDYWEDAKKLAFARKIEPTDIKLLVASTHAHALGLGSLSLILAVMLCMTSWPRAWVGLLTLLSGMGLLVDLGCWWIAREQAWAVYAIIAGGGMYCLATTLSGVSILLDLLRPAPR